MIKHVVVIASGETERTSLPFLTRHLEEIGINIQEIRTPPRTRALNVSMAEQLIKASWYSNLTSPPDKFVVLVDTNGHNPDDTLRPFQEGLIRRLEDSITVPVLFAYAQPHLEAWFFGDSAGLRNFLGRNLGSVDTSDPDSIEGPKLHLANLLGDRTYTSILSAHIAEALDGHTIAERSRSFQHFIDALKNGDSPP